MMVDNSSAERPDPGGSSGLPPLARRRLIKSAIGTPVVLSSLASKPVLGGPHGCLPSNGTSPTPNSHSPTDCSTQGQSATYWQSSTTSWPTRQIKTSTDFNGFKCGSQRLRDIFYKNKTGGGTRPATMLEVLNDNNPLGRATVVSLLNAYWRAGSYPVTDAQIVQMFNLASTGQDYPVGSGSANLTPQQVLSYLESLYPRG